MKGRDDGEACSLTSSMRLLRSRSTVCGGSRRIKSRAQSSW